MEVLFYPERKGRDCQLKISTALSVAVFTIAGKSYFPRKEIWISGIHNISFQPGFDRVIMKEAVLIEWLFFCL
jgi:hypothetical protein